MRAEALQTQSDPSEPRRRSRPHLVRTAEQTKVKTDREEATPDSQTRRMARSESRVIINEELARPRAVIAEQVAQSSQASIFEAAKHIEKYFLDAPALAKYVTYLEQQHVQEQALDAIELPNGIKMSELGFTKRDLPRLISELKENLDVQTRTAFVMKNMKNLAPRNQEELEQRARDFNMEGAQIELRDISRRTAELQERLTQVRASQGPLDRLKHSLAWLGGTKMLSGKAKEMHEIQKEILALENRSHILEEEIQMRVYEEKQVPINKYKREVSAKELQAFDDAWYTIAEEHAEQRERALEKQKEQKSKDAQNSKALTEELRKRQDNVLKTISQPYISHRTKEAQTYSREQALIQRELQKNISLKEAERLIPNAHALWNVVQEELNSPRSKNRKLKNGKSEEESITHFIDSWQASNEAPATKFVLEVARLEKAKNIGASVDTIKDLEEKIRETARLLYIGRNKEMELALEPDVLKQFTEAKRDIADADKIIDLIHQHTGYTPSPENPQDVSIDAIRYLAFLERYNKAQLRGDKVETEQLEKEFVILNSVFDIADNALIQKVTTQQSAELSPSEKVRRSVNARSRKAAARSDASRPAGFIQ